jgi:hypothetical protein
VLRVRRCDTQAIYVAAGWTGRTKSSSALLPKVAFLGESCILADMSMSTSFSALPESFFASLLNSASKVVRKGLRDIGLLSALTGVERAGEGRAGLPALLRNGFLEEKLRARPGEGRLSVDKGRAISRSSFRHCQRSDVGETSDKGALPGIDGSAFMMAPMLQTLLQRPIKRSVLRPASRK